MQKGWLNGASCRGDPCGRPAAGCRMRERATARVAPTGAAVLGRHGANPLAYNPSVTASPCHLPFLIKTAHGAGIRIGGYGLHKGGFGRGGKSGALKKELSP